MTKQFKPNTWYIVLVQEDSFDFKVLYQSSTEQMNPRSPVALAEVTHFAKLYGPNKIRLIEDIPLKWYVSSEVDK